MFLLRVLSQITCIRHEHPWPREAKRNYMPSMPYNEAHSCQISQHALLHDKTQPVPRSSLQTQVSACVNYGCLEVNLHYSRHTLGLQSPACTVALTLNSVHASMPCSVLSAGDSPQCALSQVPPLRSGPD